jgi:lysophospholipase L1-like esterase
MKILFFGDSITDAGRARTANGHIDELGFGYVRVLADRLVGADPEKYQVINRGISGNRIVDLYARVKCDVWNEEPDLISILIGINDIWHEIGHKNGVELDRFERVYRMLIEDTIKVLPNTKMILCEPFVLEGCATVEEGTNKFERFCEAYDYAKVVEKLTKEFNFPYVKLQQKFTEKAKTSKAEYYLADGVHPHTAGATLIADEWMKVFDKYIK